MIENIVISALVTLAIGFPLSIYAGAIVARYVNFDSAINQARSLILNLEQEWEYRYLDKTVPDPESPSGKRTVFMSKALASNSASWQLTQIGLLLKELGHWQAGIEMDRIGMEIDGLRDEFLDKAKFAVAGSSVEVLEYIADWHRRISAQTPSLWPIIKPWANSKYKSLSCVSVNEGTGEWHEVEPEKRKPVI
jgi:hypothetical protein